MKESELYKLIYLSYEESDRYPNIFFFFFAIVLTYNIPLNPIFLGHLFKEE